MSYYNSLQLNNMKVLPLTRKRLNVLDQMKNIALKSNLRSKHCACLVKKNNEIVSFEINQYTPHSNTVTCSVHAEVSLHKNLNKRYIKKFHRTKFNLWVIRYSNKNGLVDSKPCSKCIKYMKKNMDYVDKIIYSNQDGQLNCETIENINSNHISIGYKMRFRKN